MNIEKLISMLKTCGPAFVIRLTAIAARVRVVCSWRCCFKMVFFIGSKYWNRLWMTLTTYYVLLVRVHLAEAREGLSKSRARARTASGERSDQIRHYWWLSTAPCLHVVRPTPKALANPKALPHCPPTCTP